MPMTLRRSARPFTLLLLIVLTSAPSVVAAQEDPKVLAREAYARGEALAVAGDYRGAAREFAAADELVPNPTALGAALEAALRADDPVLGMDLVVRAERTAADQALPTVSTARSRFSGRVGVLTFPCLAEVPPCKPRIAGREVRTSRVHVLPGRYDVTFEGAPPPTPFEVFAGDEQRVAPASAEVTPVPQIPAPDSGGLSPMWTLLPGGLTVVFGGVLVAAAVQGAGFEADLEAAQQAGLGEAAQQEILDEGTRWNNVAYGFVGLTSAAAVASVIVLVVSLTGGSDEPPPTAFVAPIPGGWVTGLQGSF